MRSCIWPRRMREKIAKSPQKLDARVLVQLLKTFGTFLEKSYLKLDFWPNIGFSDFLGREAFRLREEKLLCGWGPRPCLCFAECAFLPFGIGSAEMVGSTSKPGSSFFSILRLRSFSMSAKSLSSSMQTSEQAHPSFPAATGTANAVDVIFWNVWELKIHYMRQLVNIEAACSDIGRNEYFEHARFKICERFSPCRLAFVAVDCLRDNPINGELLGELVGAMFSTGKD